MGFLSANTRQEFSQKVYEEMSPKDQILMSLRKNLSQPNEERSLTRSMVLEGSREISEIIDLSCLFTE